MADDSGGVGPRDAKGLVDRHSVALARAEGGRLLARGATHHPRGAILWAVTDESIAASRRIGGSRLADGRPHSAEAADVARRSARAAVARHRRVGRGSQGRGARGGRSAIGRRQLMADVVSPGEVAFRIARGVAIGESRAGAVAIPVAKTERWIARGAAGKISLAHR